MDHSALDPIDVISSLGENLKRFGWDRRPISWKEEPLSGESDKSLVLLTAVPVVFAAYSIGLSVALKYRRSRPY